MTPRADEESPGPVRTLRWDGGWFTVVGRSVHGDPTEDAWGAIERSRRVARRLGTEHRLDLPGESVVERPAELARESPPWAVTGPADDHAGRRARTAAERAEQARQRLAALRGNESVSLEDMDVAAKAAREAQREAAAARARAADTFERAALAHAAAAEVHDRLAGAGTDAAHHRARAAEHRRAAEADWAASRSRREGAADRRARSEQARS